MLEKEAYERDLDFFLRVMPEERYIGKNPVRLIIRLLLARLVNRASNPMQAPASFGCRSYPRPISGFTAGCSPLLHDSVENGNDNDDDDGDGDDNEDE